MNNENNLTVAKSLKMSEELDCRIEKSSIGTHRNYSAQARYLLERALDELERTGTSTDNLRRGDKRERGKVR